MIPNLLLVALITAAVVGLLYWAILKQKAWIGFYRDVCNEARGARKLSSI